MMHIAQAGEDRGRVLLQLGSGAPNPVVLGAAIDAAVWLAQAFQSEIEGQFVECEQLIELARHPFARATSLSGKAVGGVSLDEIERHLRFAGAAFHDQILARARVARVPFRQRIIRGEPVDALVLACSERGPWNVVALAEPFTSPECPSPKLLFELVAGTTGLLLVGPRARPVSAARKGPIVLALEDGERLPAMLAAAERLAAVQDKKTLLCLIACDEFALDELEAQARLVLAEREWADPDLAVRGRIELIRALVPRGSTGAIAEALRRLLPGLTVGQFGGLLMPEDGDTRPLAACLECPLLLVR